MNNKLVIIYPFADLKLLLTVTAYRINLEKNAKSSWQMGKNGILYLHTDLKEEENVYILFYTIFFYFLYSQKNYFKDNL